MLRNTMKTLAVLAVAGVTLAVADQAQAFGWRHRGWGGSHGSSGSSGGWYYGSSGSSGGSWGSSGGSWGSSGSSGGWYYGSSGSSGGSWGSSGGSWGSSGGSHGSSGGHYQSAPAAPTAPAPPAPSPPAGAEAAEGKSAGYHPTYGPLRSSAWLNVKVPADAKVFVNDRETTSTGTDREYVSHDLRPGARYNYNIRTEFVRDGKTVSETKSVQLVAGQSAELDFADGEQVQTANNADTRTTLIVRLPADAKLFLAGRETKATGEVREFSTSRLQSGNEWTQYAIRAVVERDGHEQVREETVTLKAGESREVTIGFEALASETAGQTAAR
ncbi:MAG: TIGR03000 domain-containing protein [Pirellulales bacterium]